MTIICSVHVTERSSYAASFFQQLSEYFAVRTRCLHWYIYVHFCLLMFLLVFVPLLVGLAPMWLTGCFIGRLGHFDWDESETGGRCERKRTSDSYKQDKWSTFNCWSFCQGKTCSSKAGSEYDKHNKYKSILVKF